MYWPASGSYRQADADGTPATDLAAGLRLVLTRLDGSPDPASIDGDDYSAGSS